VLPISAAAAVVGSTPRMLRYRERLGLLPPARTAPGAHRRYSDAAIRAARAAADVEQAYDVGPEAVAFALRALTDPVLRARLQRLGELAGRIQPTPVAALDFDAAKARTLLRLPLGSRE
jgi:MerR family transcriptional regulator, copper efflux regulator